MDNFYKVRFKSDQDNVVRLFTVLKKKLHDSYEVVIDGDSVLVTPPVLVVKNAA